MMFAVQEGVRRLVTGLKRAGLDPELGPASTRELAGVTQELPLSPELIEWYSNKGPREDLDLEWGALTFFLHSLPGLVAWQEGWRWAAGRRGQVDPAWRPEWVVIGNWDGDPAIADTGKPGTPVYRAAHGEGDWTPVLIAPSLGAFLAGVGIWTEIVHGKYEGDVQDEDYNMRADVSQALEAALEPVVGTECCRCWIAFE